MYICITGLRSVGKSTLACSLAQAHGLLLFDTDVVADRELTRSGSSLLSEMKQQRYERIYDAILSKLPVALDDSKGAVIAAGWGCFQNPGLARLLTTRTFIVAVTPSTDPGQAAEALYPRERLRDHFDHLNDDDLMELCRRDARNGIVLLLQHCHAALLVGSREAEEVHDQLQALLESRNHLVPRDADTVARGASNPPTALRRRTLA